MKFVMLAWLAAVVAVFVVTVFKWDFHAGLVAVVIALSGPALLWIIYIGVTGEDKVGPLPSYPPNRKRE